MFKRIKRQLLETKPNDCADYKKNELFKELSTEEKRAKERRENEGDLPQAIQSLFSTLEYGPTNGLFSDQETDLTNKSGNELREAIKKKRINDFVRKITPGFKGNVTTADKAKKEIGKFVDKNYKLIEAGRSLEERFISLCSSSSGKGNTSENDLKKEITENDLKKEIKYWKDKFNDLQIRFTDVQEDCIKGEFEKEKLEEMVLLEKEEFMLEEDLLVKKLKEDNKKLEEDNKKLEQRLNSSETENDDQDLLDIVKDYYLSLFSRQVVKANQEKYFEYSIGGLSLIILANGLTQILTSNDKPFIRKNINRFSGTITLLGATVLSSRVVRRLI